MIKTFFVVLVLTVFALAFGIQANGQTVPGDSDLLKEFNTVDKAAVGKKFNWAGWWRYNSRHYPSWIKVDKPTATKFEFEIEANAGANSGSISGTAMIKSNKAYFDDRTVKSKDQESYGCKLLFIHHTTWVEMKESSDCGNYGGAGVSFAREKFINKNPTPYLETDFSDSGIFPTPAEDKQFKTVVGAAAYENFLDNFQLVNEGDAPDADTGAKYFIGCVRGVCPYNTGIIMLDGKGKYWGAVNFNAGEDTMKINYFTNVAEWTDKMPAAITDWAKDIDSPVIYKSKK